MHQTQSIDCPDETLACSRRPVSSLFGCASSLLVEAANSDTDSTRAEIQMPIGSATMGIPTDAKPLHQCCSSRRPCSGFFALPQLPTAAFTDTSVLTSTAFRVHCVLCVFALQ